MTSKKCAKCGAKYWVVGDIKGKCQKCGGELINDPIKDPITNADKIRNMTDEELTRFFTRLDMFCCPVKGVNCANEPKCQDCFKRWLKQEVEE